MDAINNLTRQTASDAEDISARLKLIVERARVDGADVYSRLLLDLQLWDAATLEMQKLAVKPIVRRLKPHFSYWGIREHECNGVSHRVAGFSHETTGINMALIPASSFTSFDDIDNGGWERFDIGHPFLISRTPVSRLCFAGNAGKMCWLGFPATRINLSFLGDWLEDVGGDMVLPSKEQWQYACHARTVQQHRFYWGEDVDPGSCWYSFNSDLRVHKPMEHVTKYNAFGLIDMHGNVWEQCWEREWIPEPVLIGGSFQSAAHKCSSSYYFRYATPNESIGFRPIKVLDFIR